MRVHPFDDQDRRHQAAHDASGHLFDDQGRDRHVVLDRSTL